MNKIISICLYMLVIGSIGIVPYHSSLAQPVVSAKEQAFLTEIRPFADLFEVIKKSNHFFEDPEGERQKYRLLSAEYLSLLSKNRTCPQTNEAYQRALALFKQKQWLEAKAAFIELDNQGSKFQQVCVQYKLGQIESQLGHYDKAGQRFVLTYRLVADKAYPDPLHLGIESLGEMAGSMLDQIGKRDLSDKGIMTWKVGVYKKGSALYGNEYEGNSWILLEKAIDYYARQVNLGEVTGIDSISVVLLGITDPNNQKAKILLKKAILTDQIRNILWAYLFNAQKGVYFIASPESRAYILSVFLETVDNKDIDIGGTEGYIAALAYQNQNIVKAKQFAQYRWVVSKELDPLAGWILAKIAYKKGDIKTAKIYYAKALTAVVMDEQSPETLKKYIAQENDIINRIPIKNGLLSP